MLCLKNKEAREAETMSIRENGRSLRAGWRESRIRWCPVGLARSCTVRSRSKCGSAWTREQHDLIFVSTGTLDYGLQVRGKEPSEEATATDQVRAGDGMNQSSSKGGGETGLDSGSVLKIDA